MILQDRKRLAFAEHLSNLIADADSLKSSARLELATERSEILRADVETELGSPPMHPFTKIITRVIILTDCASQESLAVDEARGAGSSVRHRLTRSPDPTGARSQAEERLLFKPPREDGSWFRAELGCS